MKNAISTLRFAAIAFGSELHLVVDLGKRKKAGSLQRNTSTSEKLLVVISDSELGVIFHAIDQRPFCTVLPRRQVGLVE